MHDEQRRNLVMAVLKVVGVAVVVGAVIGLGVLVVVKALGLSGTPATHSPARGDTAVPSALPTVALSSPGGSESSTPTDTPSETPTPGPDQAIRLSATPVSVQPLQRIDLTGTWSGPDNTSLQVQRMENGAWTDFSTVQAQLRGGTFTTYVMTSRPGANRFRVRDPASGKASNAVTVTVG